MADSAATQMCEYSWLQVLVCIYDSHCADNLAPIEEGIAAFWGNPCTARARRTHCVLLLDMVLPKEPPGTPLANAPEFRSPKLP